MRLLVQSLARPPGRSLEGHERVRGERKKKTGQGRRRKQKEEAGGGRNKEAGRRKKDKVRSKK